jgi:hypothetical protein
MMSLKIVLRIHIAVLFLSIGWSFINANSAPAIHQEGLDDFILSVKNCSEKADNAKSIDASFLAKVKAAREHRFYKEGGLKTDLERVAKTSNEKNAFDQETPSTHQKQEATEPFKIKGGKWRRTPLLLRDAEIPDMPEARLRAFGQAFWLESGVLVFWAQASLPGKKNEEWGLFSFKDNQLRTVMMQGEKQTSRYVSATGRGRTETMNLYRFDAPKGWTRGPRAQTPIHAGKRLLYLSADSGQVYAWNGESLIRILGKDDELTLRGERFQIGSARVLSIIPDGMALIYFKTKGPRKTNGWIFHDETTLTSSWMAGDSLPGLAGAHIENMIAYPMHTYIVGDSHKDPLYSLGVIKPWISSDAILAVLSVTGAPYKQALFRLTREKAEAILVEGQPDPLDPNEKIDKIVDFAAVDADTLAVHVSRFKFLKGSGDILLLYQNGKFRRIFDASLAPRDYNDFSVRSVTFLRKDPPLVLFMVKHTSKAHSKVDIHGNTYNLILHDFICYDEGGLSNLTEKIFLGELTRLHSSHGDIPGIFIETRLNDFEQMIDLAKLGLPLPTGRLFLSFNATKAELMPPSEFSIEENRSINLGDVVTMMGPGQAIVQLEDGFHLLAKIE